MIILFQVLRWAFYAFTLIIGVVLLRGEAIFGLQLARVLAVVLMPAYLLLCGVMVGYLISLIWSGKDSEDQVVTIKEQILKKSFIIGIVIGLVLALGSIIL